MTARYLCAICVDRPAETLTAWERDDGTVRTIVACRPCLAPVPDPVEEYEPSTIRPARDWSSSTRNAVMAALRRLGTATARQVTDEIGGDEAIDVTAVRGHLQRLASTGSVCVDGELYRAVGDSLTPSLVAGLAFLPSLPDAFSGDDAAQVSGLAGHKLGPVMRALASAGLIVKTAARYVSGDRVVPSQWRKAVSRAA